ncbi:MAG: hypothetical protein ABFD12_14795 [Syntrophorhabdus sp.]
MWGDPIAVSPELSSDDIEKKRKELEATLIELTEEAEKIACGK